MAVFLEVIEWFDETGRTMMHRIPEQALDALRNPTI